MQRDLLEAERVHSIVGAFFAVYNYYGYGLSERVYAGALEYELRDRGHDVHELRVPVLYKGRHVAWQRLDMVVDGRVVVENKATAKLIPADRIQVISYLKVTSFAVGLLLHYRPTPQFERFIDYPKGDGHDGGLQATLTSPG
jgi:GxxExxY protein